MIYDIMRYKLWLLYSKLKKINIVIYGIKTDCVLVRESKEELSKFIKFNNVIGGFKFEEHKIPIDKKITLKFNKLIEFKQPEVNMIQMINEYDVNEMKTILQSNNNGMINGDLPGSGKTTGIKNSGYKVLFITPYNKLCQELRKYGYEAITLNK